jgi:hypothetical protein
MPNLKIFFDVKKLNIFDNLIRRRFKQYEKKDILMYPNGRRDVKDLSDWFKLMMKRAKSLEMATLREYFDYHQLVFGACIEEIIKQVSVDCKERGNFLDWIW